MGSTITLLAMLIICGVNIYIAMQMKKRMDQADTLLDEMSQITGTSTDIERLASSIVKTEKIDSSPAPVEVEETSSTSASSEITVLRTLPPKKRAKKSDK